MSQLIEKIRVELLKKADEKTKKNGQNFFKEQIHLYGVKSSDVSKIAKEFFNSLKKIDKSEVFKYCEELWQSGNMEESFIACNWSYNIRADYSLEDYTIFENWVRMYISNWASCDTFCNHTMGAYLEKYPEYLQKLKIWAASNNRWLRRASTVSLIIPARKGLFLKEIFEIADILLADQDDLVQKGYGWMLKAASQAHQKQVFDYVIKNKLVMPRTALRYAIEKMPAELKSKAMKKQFP